MSKIALVTGGARGIGEAVCRELSHNGWQLVIHCNSSIHEAKALCEELGNADYVQADLSTSQGVELIAQKCPSPDAIINNAGVALVSLFDAVSPEEYNKMYQINLLSPVNLVRRLLPSMLSKKSGVIVNISSVFGVYGGSCEVDYSASKSALIGFTKALAKEVGPSGVRVNCVCPGVIDTDMNSDLSFDDIELLCQEIPLGVVGEPEDVADAVGFLVSDKAKYITGAVLDINGGWQG